MEGRILKATAFLLSLRLSGFAQTGEWHWISPAQPLGTYAVAVGGSRVYFLRDYVVSYTADGGTTFVVPPPYAPTNDVTAQAQTFAFADSLRGYLNDGAHGGFRTTDGGLHWMFETNGVGPLIAFGSSRVGWQVGPWRALKTTDGGNTWVSRNTPFLSTGGNFSRLFCLGDSLAWVAKSFWYSQPTEGSIWRTTDGGTSWTHLNTGLLSDSMHQLTYVDLAFGDSGVGFVIGTVRDALSGASRTFLLRTIDFGLSWDRTDSLEATYESILSITDSTWLLFGTTGSALAGTASVVQRKTVDAGTTWSAMRSITPRSSLGFTGKGYVPNSHTIIVTTLVGLWRSVDFGETYASVSQSPEIFVKSIAMDPLPKSATEQMVVAASYNRSYLFSRDGGHSWVSRQLPEYTGGTISGFAIAESTMYAVTNQSDLWKSTNLGISWTRLQPINSGGIRALSAYNRSSIAAQGYPNVLTSVDGGSSWSYSPYGNSFWWNDLQMISPDEMIAVGGFYGPQTTRGFIYHTTDRGHNWRIEDTPSEMRQVVMLAGNSKGYAIGTYQVYGTTDRGVTWNLNRSSTDYYDHYGDLCFRDSLFGLMQNGYYFLETTDGGSKWTKKSLFVPICCDDSKMVYTQRGNLLVASYMGFFSYLNAGSEGTGKVGGEDILSGNYVLHQNYPNPFNPSTTIRYGLPNRSHVTLTIFNTLGQIVATLVQGEKEAGYHEVQFDGTGLSSGVYFYRLHVGDYVATKKLLILK